MEWTDISITVKKADADTAEAIATMIANGGIYIEDYSDLEEQVQAIVLGCTELPLIFGGVKLPVPYIDVMQIHIKALVDLITTCK